MMPETTLITVDALIIAGLLAWAGAWRDTYKIYLDNSDPVWHVSLSLSTIYISVLATLASLICATVSLTQTAKGLWYYFSIALAGFSLTILFSNATLSAFSAWIKAMRGDKQWHPLRVSHRSKLWTVAFTCLAGIVLIIWIVLSWCIFGPALAT
jgi:hypothetical protein